MFDALDALVKSIAEAPPLPPFPSPGNPVVISEAQYLMTSGQARDDLDAALAEGWVIK